MYLSIAKIIFLASLILSSGCTAIQPFPMVARVGDTITLAVGSQDGMNLGNTTVIYTSDYDGIPVDITSSVRSIFTLYAEKSSNIYSPNIAFYLKNFKYLHHEPWQTVILIDLPSLHTGTGVVRVSTALPQPYGPLEPGPVGTYPDLNTVDIDLEILPGAGTVNPFRYKTVFGGTLNGNTYELEPGRQVLIRPPKVDPGGLWSNTFGAIEIVMNMPMADLGGDGLDDSSIRVVAQDVSMYTGSQSQFAWKYNGSDFTIMFLSPPGKIKYYEPRFSIMAELDDFAVAPTITSVTYYDINGGVVTGPAITDYAIELLGTY